ncbi:MAG TPA: DUF1918 domain-containing protein [Gaiellaceae bacterium]|nr:DUF1918 domain-containing protein [Gaiellaceae bacterium]
MVVRRQVEVAAGDVVEVSGRRVGDSGRLGEIVELLGTADHRHYLVRWEDGHESILYPGEATTIRSRPRPRRRRKSKHEPAAATVEPVEILRDAEIEFELLPHRRVARVEEAAGRTSHSPA